MDNREQIISENIGLVHACAKRFKSRGMEYDDLFQAGCVGLVKAVDGKQRRVELADGIVVRKENFERTEQLRLTAAGAGLSRRHARAGGVPGLW